MPIFPPPPSAIPSKITQPNQMPKSIAQAHARVIGPAGVSNRHTPSGVVSDRRPSSNSGIEWIGAAGTMQGIEGTPTNVP